MYVSFILFYQIEKVLFSLDLDHDLSFMTATVGPIEDQYFHLTNMAAAKDGYKMSS